VSPRFIRSQVRYSGRATASTEATPLAPIRQVLFGVLQCEPGSSLAGLPISSSTGLEHLVGNQRWHRIVCQMVEKLNRGINSLSTGWASRHNNATTALRDRWRLINELRKIVSVNFFLDCSKQNGFMHVRTPDDVQRKGRNDRCLDNPVVQ
jgi:hypothetical protein